jgi:hypothetical protein
LSFDLAAFSGTRPLTRERVVDAYVRLSDDPDGWKVLLEADPAVEAFVAEISARWPQIDDVPNDEVDDCPWNVAFDQSTAHVSSAIAFSRADEVAPVYIDAAVRHGLYVYDPQDDKVYAPDS